MKKKSAAFLICLLLLLWIPLPALAVQNSNLIEHVWIDGTEMTLICVGMESNQQYEVKLDGQPIPVSASRIRREEMPVTVYCLVDTSGSISSYKMNLLRGTLLELSDSMTDGDSMVIATVDDQLIIGEELHTAQERAAAIEAIASSQKDTNLYAGIVGSLDRLASAQDYNTCRCLVILSDGVDCQDNGMTEQEVMNAVKNARLPVYTVALVQNSSEREGGKILGSFARGSYGGVHLTTVKEGANSPIRWDVSGVEFGSIIWNYMQDTAVLTADLSKIQIDPNKSEVQVSVSYTYGSSTYSDSITLDASVFPVPAEEATESTEPLITEPGKQESIPDIPGAKPKLWVIFAIAAATVVLIAAIVLLAVKKAVGKKEAQETPDKPEPPIAVPEPLHEEPIRQEKPAGDPRPEPKYVVRMIDIPHGTQHLSFTLPACQEVSFGRDKRSQNIVNQKDRLLSGVHFSIMIRDGIYCVRDENSLNGTLLNGVPVSSKGWTKLYSGDKLRAGSYEYRMIIEPVEELPSRSDKNRSSDRKKEMLP